MSYPTDFVYDATAAKVEEYPDFMYLPFQGYQGNEMDFSSSQVAPQSFFPEYDMLPQEQYAYPSFYTPSGGMPMPNMDFRPNTIPQFRKKGAPPKQPSRSSATLPSVHITSTGKRCTNCRCEETPSWRRCQNGINLLCNACGLYEKLHCRPRPIFVDKDGYIKVVRDRRPRSSN